MLVLTNIKASRFPNRVNLVFSDGSYLPFFIDDTIKLSLKKNQSITPKLLTKITTTSLTYLGTDYSLRQIALSPKTEKIIADKLKLYFSRLKHKFVLFSSASTAKIITDIILQLKSKKLLNPDDFISSFITRNKSKSVSEIKFLLRQKGINSQDIPNLPSKNDIDAIKTILAKKKPTRKLMADFKQKQRLYASLFRRGFQISDIKAAIDDYLSLK
jgi:SOS response regulatory protein OraA/RecX